MKVKGFVAFCFLLAAGALSAHAQTPYDPPTVSFVESGFWRITIEITAGPSGAPNGFGVDWMTKSDYDIYGWPTDGEGSVYSQYCDFTGVPTLNDAGVPSFQLGPNEAARVQLGDLFDETGTYATYGDGLPDDTEYVVRVHAEGDNDRPESDYSSTLIVSTARAECTQGFWKNHEEVWPLGCLPMMLGNVLYTKAQLLAILNTPAQGNGLISLAHQLIATKLNYCNGSNTSNVAATIAAADAIIGNLVIPTDYLAPGSTSGYTETLDDYNNGRITGVSNCPTPVLPSTWSQVKTLHR